MNPLKSLIFPLALAIALATSITSTSAQTVTATISGVADGSGNYDYTITLYNTDPYYSINGFWYGWTYNGNNLYSNPSSADNSIGWTELKNAGVDECTRAYLYRIRSVNCKTKLQYLKAEIKRNSPKSPN